MKNDTRANWTFFSNYAHVLICLTHRPQPTTREMAMQVGITERAVQRIVSRLVAAGIVNVVKDGRRNRYTIDLEQNLRHALEAHRTVGEFINLMESGKLASD